MFWGHTCLSWKQASSLPVGLGRDTVMEMAALQGGALELWGPAAGWFWRGSQRLGRGHS